MKRELFVRSTACVGTLPSSLAKLASADFRKGRDNSATKAPTLASCLKSEQYEKKDVLRQADEGFASVVQPSAQWMPPFARDEQRRQEQLDLSMSACL